MSRLLRLLGVALLLGCGLAASARAESWDEVVAAAKKEGTVVVYHAQSGQPYFLTILKSFEQKYGIQVQQLGFRASELTERVRVEQSSGRHLADLEFHGYPTIVQQTAAGFIVPHGGVPNANTLREPFAATDRAVPVWVQLYGMLVNTRLVKPEDYPSKWADLLEPKWKGRILSDDVRASGAGQVFFTATQEAYGTPFHEKLAAQGLVFSRDLRNDARRVARGEFPLYSPQAFNNASDLVGLPVRVIVPEDGVPYVLVNAAMLRGAPHPNAARVLINHFLELQSQITLGKGWMGYVGKGVADHLDDEARRLTGAKLLGTTTVENQQPMLDLAQRIYK